MISLAAEYFKVSEAVVWQWYWIGFFMGIALTIASLLFSHYKQYYEKLNEYIEHENRRGPPVRDIDGGAVVGGALLAGVVGGLWPVVVCGAALVGVCLAIVTGCKWIVNLPGDTVEKLLVKKQRNKMLTSPNHYIRELAEKHSRKKKDK